MTRSARGLFRATGKKSKPVAARLPETGEIVKVEHLEREGDEFYPTPPEPTVAFLSHPEEAARLADFPVIWEPAAGDGAMVRIMEAFGHLVFSSDLIDRGIGAEIKDFFSFTGSPPSRAIFTNPPFDKVNWRDGKARWLYHALETLDVEYMALLLPWPFPGAGGLGKFWAKHPPARVYLLRWKVDFTGQGAPPMLNAWFVWDRKHQGETVLRMLDRDDARQGEMF